MNKSKDVPTDYDQLTFREFNEFNVDVMRAADLHHHGAVASIDLNEVSFNAVDFDSHFRSIRAVDPSSLADFAPRHFESTTSFGPPSLKRGGDVGPTAEKVQVLDSKAHIDIVIESSHPHVPERPFYIGPSHFNCPLALPLIRREVEQQLHNVMEVSFKFHPNDCRWEAVYLRGSSRCKFEVNIYYKDESKETFVVEGNRLSGDCFPFRNIFKSIKIALGADMASPIPSFSDSIPLPAGEDLSIEDARKSLDAIVEMARCKHIDTRAEAAKIFCDLSLQQSMHALLCDSGCILVLVELLQLDHDCCKQHAACALANLSSSRPCQDLLLNNPSFLPTLITLTVDGPYDSSEMRRECARMLANICVGLAPRVVGSLGVDKLSTWVSGVPLLKDERLRMHAERARQYIMPCM